VAEKFVESEAFEGLSRIYHAFARLFVPRAVGSKTTTIRQLFMTLSDFVPGLDLRVQNFPPNLSLNITVEVVLLQEA